MKQPDNQLTDKYRPKTLKEVIGQDAAIKSLRGLIERNQSHAFIFSGPAGTGKTTLARIAARELGANDTSLLEIDAATNTGIDAMREVMRTALYRPMSGTAKAVIIDEAHALSKQAWTSMLKGVEEPPSYVYWFFCTTNLVKIPTAIKTRCKVIPLREVPIKDLEELADNVLAGEGILMSDGVFDVCVREANGSPRQLIQNLDTCRACDKKADAARLLQKVLETDPVIDLCRLLISGGSWIKAMAIIERMDQNENPEGVRLVVCNYIAKALLNAKSDKNADRLLLILDAFAQPYNQSENLAPLLLSIGNVLRA